MRGSNLLSLLKKTYSYLSLVCVYKICDNVNYRLNAFFYIYFCFLFCNIPKHKNPRPPPPPCWLLFFTA
ncbi:hypothetical protein CsSME_00020005 [Camellia sinensis var. sinensis]